MNRRILGTAIHNLGHLQSRTYKTWINMALMYQITIVHRAYRSYRKSIELLYLFDE